MGLRTTTLLAALPPVLAVLPGVALLAVAGDRLPDPVAVHFALDGTADGFLPRGDAAAVDIALGLFLAALFGGLSRTVDGPSAARTGTLDGGVQLVAGSWAAAGVLGPVLLIATAVNLDLADASAAVLPVWAAPLALVTGALTGFVGYRLAPRPAAPADRSTGTAPLTVGPTEQVSWSRRVSGRGFLVLTLFFAAGAAGAVAVGAPPAVVLPSALIACAALLLGSARVTVDRRGLTVALGLLGWPRVRVPVQDVASVTTADVDPLQFGGWGYRIVPGGRGIIVRRGPALVVTQRSGRRLTVTVDDPGTAAGLLAGLVRC